MGKPCAVPFAEGHIGQEDARREHAKDKASCKMDVRESE